MAGFFLQYPVETLDLNLFTPGWQPLTANTCTGLASENAVYQAGGPAMKDPVREMLDEAGYADGVIDDDFDYANTEGWSAFDEPGQFRTALSGRLYDDDALRDEDCVPWEPVGWDDD